MSQLQTLLWMGMIDDYDESSGWMFLLVPAHPGFPGQIPQSRKTVVCVCVVDGEGCFGIYQHIVLSTVKIVNECKRTASRYSRCSTPLQSTTRLPTYMLLLNYLSIYAYLPYATLHYLWPNTWINWHPNWTPNSPGSIVQLVLYDYGLQNNLYDHGGRLKTGMSKC